VQRFSLHELVRVFVAARLVAGDAVQRRYAQHYAWVADGTDKFYLEGGAATLAGLALFDRERTHIDAGWGWAMAHAGDQDADALLLDYANATMYIGDLRYDKRRERIPQQAAALAAAQRLKDRGAEGQSLGNLGLAYDLLGDGRKAIDFSKQHFAIVREIGDRRGEGNALGNLGSAYADLGDARQAIAFYEQRLVIARAIGDRRGEALASWNLGLALEKEGDLARAAELMHVRVDFEQEIGHPDAAKVAAHLEQVRQRLAGGGDG
jgi:tetratricopeptide (TPR) repeat protein